jgi:hypothetical protein
MVALPAAAWYSVSYVYRLQMRPVGRICKRYTKVKSTAAKTYTWPLSPEEKSGWKPIIPLVFKAVSNNDRH